jgi:hypothetical protein
MAGSHGLRFQTPIFCGHTLHSTTGTDWNFFFLVQVLRFLRDNSALTVAPQQIFAFDRHSGT